MQEFMMKLGNDYTLMLIAGVALAVLLIILLVILVSAMKVKTYTDRYWNTKVDNEEKTEYITALEHELETYKLKNTKNEQALEQFGQTKETLRSTSETLSTLQEKYHALENELAGIKSELESTQAMHAALLEEHSMLKERYELAVEDNNRYRTNNARLLMKLESEERQISSKEERMNNYKKEIKTKITSLARKVSTMNPQKCGELSKEDLEKFMLSFSQDLIKISESVEQIKELNADENR